MIRDMIDHPATLRAGDILAVTALALTATQTQTYIAIVVGVLAGLVYLTKLIDWWRDRNE